MDSHLRAIRQAVIQGYYVYTFHAQEKMFLRGITRHEVEAALLEGEVIEHDETREEGETCLILGRTTEDRVLHVACGLSGRIRVLTAYEPDPGEWEPGFRLGAAVATPGALEAMESAGHIPPEFLLRHVNGDWGDLDEEDRHENELSVREGLRVFSAYRTRLDQPLWCITEWDRSATTLLLPSEY